MTEHRWHFVGIASKPEYVGPLPRRRDIAVRPNPRTGSLLTPSSSQTRLFICTACNSFANGEEEKDMAEPCDVVKVRRVLES